MPIVGDSTFSLSRITNVLHKPDLKESRITPEIGLPTVEWRKTGLKQIAANPADGIITHFQSEDECLHTGNPEDCGEAQRIFWGAIERYVPDQGCDK